MLQNSGTRAKIKTVLVISNLILGIALAILTIYWFAQVKPEQMNLATRLDQYRSYSLTNLPDEQKDVIEADYIGTHKIVGRFDQLDVIDEIDRLANNLQENSSFGNDNTNGNYDELRSRDEQTYNNNGTSEIQKIGVSKKPKIAILITNLGLNKRSTEKATDLPKECSLGFVPYTKTHKQLLHSAQNKGHEIYLYLPLEIADQDDDPGQFVLKNDLDIEENVSRLRMILSSHARYDGIYTNEDEIYTSDLKSAEFLLDFLEDKNLIFLYGKGINNNTKRYFQVYDNILPVQRIIDIESEKATIIDELNKLVQMSKANGMGLAYIKGNLLSIEALADWLKTIDSRGVELVPVSELMRK